MPKRAAGCFECRKRKVWCDDTRPQCNNCMRRGTKCPGYRPTQAFLLHNFDASLDILHKSSNRKAYDVLSRLPLHEEDYASPLKRINSKIYPPAPILVDGMYPGLGPMLVIRVSGHFDIESFVDAQLDPRFVAAKPRHWFSRYRNAALEWHLHNQNIIETAGNEAKRLYCSINLPAPCEYPIRTLQDCGVTSGYSHCQSKITSETRTFILIAVQTGRADALRLGDANLHVLSMRNHSVIVVPAWSTRRGFAKFTYQGPIPDPENGILAAEDHEADFDRHISSSIVVFDHGVSTALRNHIGEKDHAVMLLSLAGFESLDNQRNSYASLSATSKLEGRNQMRSSEEASAGTQQGWISKQTRQPHFRIDDNGSQFQMHWTPESGTRGYYHLDYLGESTVYNTLKWDQEQYMYIYRDSDGTRAYWNGTWFSKTKPSTEHEDAYIKSTSGQGQDSHSLDSTAISQAGDRSSPILDAMSSKLRATWLEALEGDAANTRAGIQPFSSRFAGSALTPDHSQDTNLVSGTVNSDTKELSHHMSSETISLHDWKEVRSKLPVDWQFDVEYHVIKVNKGGQHGCWTCTPLELNEPKCYPLTIAGAPVILPVDYRWPPESGLMPPPDPRATMPIDCRATLPLALVKDLFLTFQGSIGFYVLINGLLQVIVPKDYDTSWASSHLPHKYGGLKVCYIERNLEPTMLPSATDTSRATTSGSPVGPHGISGSFRPASLSAQSVTRYPSLKLDDFIEARPLSNHTRDRFSGRVGLRVARAGVEPLVVMSTHVITEAILAKSRRDTIFGRSLDDRLRKLEDDWNDHVEIWAGDRKVGTIDSTFDIDAEFYPVGFNHDITLIKPSSPAVVQGIASPIANLGWLHQNSWSLLRQQTSTVEILADTEISQSGRSIRCSRPSDVLVVGEGIFLNQKAAAGSSKSLKDHDASTWNDLVSRALLYRVYPDFDPPNGHSGTALYADGVREDGTEGPGIAGFQSFVQRSGHVQNFEMEGPALERRLQLGRVAFYGAFEVPSELKQYDIV